LGSDGRAVAGALGVGPERFATPAREPAPHHDEGG
jgi:hypothetical protein